MPEKWSCAEFFTIIDEYIVHETFSLFSTATTIGSITKNYRLAFGSFVDKTVSPYIQVER